MLGTKFYCCHHLYQGLCLSDQVKSSLEVQGFGLLGATPDIKASSKLSIIVLHSTYLLASYLQYPLEFSLFVLARTIQADKQAKQKTETGKWYDNGQVVVIALFCIVRQQMAGDCGVDVV